MTTGDSQSVQTTNTVCPIKSQLIHISARWTTNRPGGLAPPTTLLADAERVAGSRWPLPATPVTPTDGLASPGLWL